MKTEISYFGFSKVMLEKLINYNDFKICSVITQCGKSSNDFWELCKNNNINCYSVDKKDLEKYANELSAKNVIMYEFGIIVPNAICSSFNIVNFHPGNLKTNRGANPISWSILDPNIGAEICAYRIIDQIDCGYIISRKKEDVSDKDDPISLKKKLELNIDVMLKDVNQYFKFSSTYPTVYVENGIYRNRVKPIDYTIDLQNDSPQIIIRKINSQIPYDGAIINIDGAINRVKKYNVSEDKILMELDSGMVTYDILDKSFEMI